MLVVGCVTACLLCSCIPVFETPPPLDVQASEAVSRRMTGTWEASPEGGDRLRLLVYRRPSGYLDLLTVDHLTGERANSGVRVEAYEGYPVSVGPSWFLCFRGRGLPAADDRKAGTSNEWMLAWIEIPDPARLSLRLMSQQKVRALIEEGRLGGRVEEGRFIDKVIVTAAPAEFGELVGEAGVDRLLSDDDEVGFRRVGD
jgi:hypothetical protein